MIERFQHESMGMVELARVSTPGCLLFGSNVKHHEIFQLRIKQAEEVKTLGWFQQFGRELLAEVELTPSQLLGLLTNMNSGGTPCTIRYVMGKRFEKYPQNLSNKFKDIVDQNVKNLGSTVEKMLEVQKVVEQATTSLSAKKKEEIRKAFDVLRNNFRADYGFYLKAINEVAEDVKEEAKRELSDYVEMLSQRYGANLQSHAEMQLELKPKLPEGEAPDVS